MKKNINEPFYKYVCFLRCGGKTRRGVSLQLYPKNIQFVEPFTNNYNFNETF